MFKSEQALIEIKRVKYRELPRLILNYSYGVKGYQPGWYPDL